MIVERYITIKAIIARNKEIIPYWDERIEYENSDYYGEVIKLKGEHNFQRFEECIYDLKTKKISTGVSLDYYPDIEKLEFKIGEVALYESSHRKLVESKIVDIVFLENDLEISKGGKIDKWYKVYFKSNSINIESNVLYAISIWKPTYVFEDGHKTSWTHQIYHKIN